MKNDGGPAFACAAENGHQEGMSLRDYFAAAALPVAAEMSKSLPMKDLPDGITAHMAVTGIAYSLADAMLKARGK